MARYLLVILSAAGLYYYLGDYAGVIAYKKQQQQQVVIQKTLEKIGGRENLIQSMAQKVKADADNPQAWFLLGRLYSADQQWPLALAAFNHAVKLAPDNIDYQLHLAMTDFVSHQGQLSPEATKLLTAIIQADAKNIPALHLLATDAEQRADNLTAIKYRRMQLAALPPESDAAQQVLRRLAGKL